MEEESNKQKINYLLKEWEKADIEPHRLLKYDPGERYFLVKLYDEVSREFSPTFKKDYYYDPAFGRDVYHTYSKVIAACLWLEDHANELLEALFNNKKNMDNLEKTSWLDISSVIVDSISPLNFPILTLSVLLAKFGIPKLYHYYKMPAEKRKNAFYPLTLFYMKDALAAQPSAHYESFLKLACIYVKQGKYDLAKKRLRDSENWVRKKKKIILPKKLRLEIIKEEKRRKSLGQERKKLKWGKHDLASDFRSVGREIYCTYISWMKKEIKPSQIKHIIYNDIAYEYIKVGDYENAQRLLDIALKKMPTESSTLDSMGWLEFKKRNYQKAEKYFYDSIQYDKVPPHNETRYHLVCTLLEQKKYGEAQKVFYDMKNDSPVDSWFIETKKIMPSV